MVAKNSTFDCTAISRRNAKSQLAMTRRAAIDARRFFLASAEGNHAALSSGCCIRTAPTTEPSPLGPIAVFPTAPLQSPSPGSLAFATVKKCTIGVGFVTTGGLEAGWRYSRSPFNSLFLLGMFISKGLRVPTKRTWLWPRRATRRNRSSPSIRTPAMTTVMRIARSAPASI